MEGAGVEAILGGHGDESLLVEKKEGGGVSAEGKGGFGHDVHAHYPTHTRPHTGKPLSHENFTLKNLT